MDVYTDSIAKVCSQISAFAHKLSARDFAEMEPEPPKPELSALLKENYKKLISSVREAKLPKLQNPLKSPSQGLQPFKSYKA